MFLESDRLVASAGADALFLLDELDPAAARALHDLWHQDQLERAPAELAAAVLDLERLGALVPAIAPPPTLAFHLATIGEAGALEAALDALLPSCPGLRRVDLSGAAVAVLVRAGGSLLSAAELAQGWTVPHLFVDAAYHHTLSLGPLVFPGETACLTCLAGRVRFTWGDPPAPGAPLAAGRAALTAGWVLDQLAVLRDTGTCSGLVSRTLSLDLDSLASRGERVHRLPWCSRCFPDEGALGDGATLLPWARGPRA